MMVNMLIFNGLLLLGVTGYGSASGDSFVGARWRRDSASPTGSTAWSAKNSEGKQFVISYSGATASDVLPAATTVHTIPTVDPSPPSTYNPYHRKGANDASPDLSYRQNVAAPNLQGGFQPSQAQASPNRPQSYNSPSYPQPGNGQFHPKAPKGNGKSQYFSNPSSYRLYSEPGKGQSRSSPFPVPGGGFPSFPKFKSSSKYPGFASNDYSFENPAKYRFVTGPNYNSQASSLLGSSQRPGVPTYNTNPQSVAKNIGGSPVALQSSSDVSGFIKAHEGEPIILSTGLDYQTHPSSSALNYEYPKVHSASLTDAGPGAFNPNAASYQPLVVPIHSSRSTSQIPQYQAATVNGFNGNRNGKPDAGYQQLANQPQLHFTTGAAAQTVGTFQPIYHSNPLEKIRTDVELIDKKSTTTASPFDSDENDFDQVFKTVDGDFSYLPDGGSSQSLKALTHPNSFELPSSNLFNSYDQAFGKYSKLASLERDNAPKFTPSSIDVASKPVYQNIKEADGAEDDEDDSSGEYRSSYKDEKDSGASYEDENEGESRRSEKQGSSDDKQEDNDDDYGSASYSSYGHDFDKEFEDSYRNDLPKSDYVHVKEVPEVDESSSQSGRQRPAKRISRLASRQSTRHVTRGNGKPKKFADSEGYASRSSYKSAKTNEPRIEESFGYKIPRDRGTKRFASNDDDDITKKDENSSSFSFGSEAPSTSTLTPITDLQSYTFPAFDDWKPTTKLPTDRASLGASDQDVRAFFNVESSSNPFPRVHRGSLTFPFNGQADRDLTGI